MSQEIKDTVTTILESKFYAVEFTYRGEKQNAFDGKNTMDEWDCAIKNSVGKRVHFEYFTGLGLRAPVTAHAAKTVAWGYAGLTANDRKGLSQYGKRYLADIEKARKPRAPHSADLLHSLVLDSDGVAQSFAHWCSDYGYDTDLRKSYATYEACQQNADKLNSILDRATLAQLRELLQDY